MAPPTRVPDKNTLERLSKTMTHQQIRDYWEEREGIVVSRAAISAAFVRYGLAGEGKRYPDYVPWRMHQQHSKAYPVRMLRFMGRRDEGLPLPAKDQRLLDSWLERLKAEKLIVGYDPDDEQGVHYIDAKFKDHRKAIPVRRRPIKIAHDTPANGG